MSPIAMALVRWIGTSLEVIELLARHAPTLLLQVDKHDEELLPLDIARENIAEEDGKDSSIVEKNTQDAACALVEIAFMPNSIMPVKVVEHVKATVQRSMVNSTGHGERSHTRCTLQQKHCIFADDDMHSAGTTCPDTVVGFASDGRTKFSVSSGIAQQSWPRTSAAFLDPNNTYGGHRSSGAFDGASSSSSLS
jgi:hypothetical protein